MSAPLNETKGKIEAHWQQLNIELAKLSAYELRAGFTSEGAVATISASETRRVNRHRGGEVEIAPLCESRSKNARFWVSYLEEWRDKGSNRYWFQSSNLTFFQSFDDDAKLVQLFRAEWPGYAEWQKGQVGWQAPGAGHPHWQFDALESYVSREARENETARLVELLTKSHEDLEEFGADDIPVAHDLIFGGELDTSWAKMHFASQALWSKSPWDGDTESVSSHSHAPSRIKEVRAWLTSVIVYVRSELSRG